MDDGEREGAQDMDPRGKAYLYDSAMAFERNTCLAIRLVLWSKGV